MTTVRIVSPGLAFSSLIQSARAATSPAKGTITVTEARAALVGLCDHPHADSADRARIVQGFLDGSDGKALSPPARAALADFVIRQGKAGSGHTAAELKAGAVTESKNAEGNLDKARHQVMALLAKGRVGTGELATVNNALDAAMHSIDDARKNLSALLQVANHSAHSAHSADTELKGAGKELAQAHKDIAAIVAHARGGIVTKAQLREMRHWLSAPRDALVDAQHSLGGSITTKYPSDNEDGGSAGGGAGGGGGVMHTMKAPSDNEDGGGGSTLPPLKPDLKPQVKKAHIDEIKKTFNDAVKDDKVQWSKKMPVGQRFESVDISRVTHPGDDQFTALIPTGALTPTATQKDPNRVDTFWVKRSGGLTGITHYAGPFSLK